MGLTLPDKQLCFPEKTQIQLLFKQKKMFYTSWRSGKRHLQEPGLYFSTCGQKPELEVSEI